MKQIAVSRGTGKTTVLSLVILKEFLKKNPREFLRQAIVAELKKEKK